MQSRILISFLVFLCICRCVELNSTATEESSDNTEAHQKFLDSLEYEGNPYKIYRHLNVTSEFSQCTTGLCCGKRNRFYPYGHICGQPADPCKLAICSGQSSECYTISAKNGTACPDGVCFDGECVKNCVGECCDGKLAKEDGTECTDGMCVSGVCVRKCKGDCCEVGQSFAKPDGAPCNGGLCENGECIRSNDDKPAEQVNIGTPAKSAANNVVVAVVNEEKEVASALDKAWSSLVGEEKKDKAAEAEKKLKEEKAKKDAEASATISRIKAENEDYQATLKAAKDEDNGEFKHAKLILIIAGAFVGLLLIVLLIALIVKRSRNNDAKKRDEEKAEEAYESF